MRIRNRNEKTPRRQAPQRYFALAPLAREYERLGSVLSQGGPERRVPVYQNAVQLRRTLADKDQKERGVATLSRKAKTYLKQLRLRLEKAPPKPRSLDLNCFLGTREPRHAVLAD